MLNKALKGLHSGVEEHFSRGDLLFRDNSKSDHLYLVLEGKIKLNSKDEDGKEFIYQIANKGDIIGNLSLDAEAYHTYEAEALCESQVLRFESSEMHNLLSRNPELLTRYLSLMQSTLNYSRFLNHELANHNPEHNILRLLQYFKQKQQHLIESTGKLELTRQQIANMLGLRVETVIRVMKVLEEKNVLKIHRGKVFIPTEIHAEN